MTLMLDKRALRYGRAVRMIALTAIAFPSTVSASNVRNETQSSVVQSQTFPLIVAVKVAANFGTVTSGFRSVAHNRRVGGVPTSYHLVGRAVDVQRRFGVTHFMLHAALTKAGFVLIESLDEGDHSHFAFGRPVAFSRADTRAKTMVASSESAPPRRSLLADNHGVLITPDFRAPSAQERQKFQEN